jgi:glycosyltransferase involved in cell wall biosynthesis
VRYLVALAGGFRAGRPDALLAHMSPIFLVLAAPLAKAARVPLGLWYVHWQAAPALRLADRLCDIALTVDRATYPLASAKVRAIGHAIDVAAFTPRTADPGDGTLRLAALGRMQPWKGFPLLLDAAERLFERGVPAKLEVRGPERTEREARHRAELQSRVAASPSLREIVTVGEAVPRDRVPELIRSSHAVVVPGGVREGGEALDKVIFETAACAVPLVASHPSLEHVLAQAPIRLSFRPGDAGDLAEVLAGVAAASPGEREEAGRMLRRWVEGEHSVEHWADRVLQELVR